MIHQVGQQVDRDDDWKDTMNIRLFVTGGTFDKDYDEASATLVLRSSQVDAMLRRGRCRLTIETEVLMMVDSLDMTDTQRQNIVEACRTCAEMSIVITHGTDTIVETAQLIAQRVGGKTIILTGAMVPAAFGGLDGLFNLASAVSFAQIQPAGVYVAMNGHCFNWDNVRKNRDEGIFEPLRS